MYQHLEVNELNIALYSDALKDVEQQLRGIQTWLENFDVFRIAVLLVNQAIKIVSAIHTEQHHTIACILLLRLGLGSSKNKADVALLNFIFRCIL